MQAQVTPCDYLALGLSGKRKTKLFSITLEDFLVYVAMAQAIWTLEKPLTLRQGKSVVN
jgi:hypothetical protein